MNEQARQAKTEADRKCARAREREREREREGERGREREREREEEEEEQLSANLLLRKSVPDDNVKRVTNVVKMWGTCT